MRMEVTAAVEFARRTGRRFFGCFLYAAARTVNGMEEIHIPTIDFNPQYNRFSSSPSTRRDTEQDDARPRQDKSGQIRESAFTNHNRGAQSGWEELFS